MRKVLILGGLKPEFYTYTFVVDGNRPTWPSPHTWDVGELLRPAPPLRTTYRLTGHKSR
jgi:hypothetical protein